MTTGPRTRLRLRPQGVLLILCGAALLRIALFSELYLRYVKEGLRPYLVISGVALIALGLVGMISRGKEEHEYEQEHEYEAHDEDAHEAHAGHGRDTHAGHGHDHTRNPRIAWLLTAPAPVP